MKKKIVCIILIMSIISNGVLSYGSTLNLSEKDIAEIALVCDAEAEGESEYGRRLVIDTVLNRMEEPYFPDSAHSVLYQSGQYECLTNGRVKRVKLKKETIDLVKEEIEYRTNNRVVFFTARRFSKYGYPLTVEGNHYFSIY